MPAVNPPSSLYPQIKVERIKDPNRFYAFPVIGGLSKGIILIPSYIELGFVLGLSAGALQIVNSFYVLFTGKYWKPCYDMTIANMRYYLKFYYFWNGLTNKYPGFDQDIDDKFSLDIEMPKTPNRLFAIPILGFLARII